MKLMRKAAWAVVGGMLLASLAPHAAMAEADGMAATSDREARDEAMRAMPWNALNPAERRTVQYIIKNATIYRRMPTRVVDCDPAVFNFLGQNPEVVTELWKMMGVANLDLVRIAPDTYRAADEAGTTGTLKFLKANWNPNAQNTILVYCEGTYQGAPLPGQLTARSVLLLRSGSYTETNGRPYVTARLDSFVVVDRLGAEMVAKTIQPLIVKTADHNFVETMKFVSNFNQTAETNPQGMQRLAGRLEKLDESTRQAMAQVCAETAARYVTLGAATMDRGMRLASQDTGEAAP